MNLDPQSSLEPLALSRSLSSLEELFCQLIALVYASELDRQKELIDAHFLERQTRAEYLYAKIVCEYKLRQVQRVVGLIEQFMLKDTTTSGGGNTGDRMYRQAKIPNLMMIRLKI